MNRKNKKINQKYKETRNAFQLLVNESISISDSKEIAENISGYFNKLTQFKHKKKGQ